MSDLYKNSLIIDIIERNSDNRGKILSLVNTKIQNVSLITCNKNSIRSNHYHLKDWHYIFVLNGQINYFYKKINSLKIHYSLIKKGENIFTPPMEIHATHFPTKTTLIVCSKNKRNKTIYEKDTVRVKFINLNNYQSYINIKK